MPWINRNCDYCLNDLSEHDFYYCLDSHHEICHDCQQNPSKLVDCKGHQIVKSQLITGPIHGCDLCKSGILPETLFYNGDEEREECCINCSLTEKGKQFIKLHQMKLKRGENTNRSFTKFWNEDIIGKSNSKSKKKRKRSRKRKRKTKEKIR